jgi:hypothetical protein
LRMSDRLDITPKERLDVLHEYSHGDQAARGVSHAAVGVGGVGGVEALKR